jgi:hypothetical protein
MTEKQLFLSSCDKRELARRRSHSWLGTVLSRVDHPAATALVFVVVCTGAFIAGRGGF